jgi:hypothetical protein
MISHFRVENYKLLSKVDIPLTPIHVIVGENDSGKTSLLEAISAYCRSAKPECNVPWPFEGKWQHGELVYLKASEPCIDLEARVEGPWSGQIRSITYGFKIRFSAPAEHGFNVADEWCNVADGWGAEGARIHILSTNQAFTGVALRAQLTPAQRGHLELDEIAALIGSCGIYRFEPRMMALPTALDPTRRYRMDQDGFGLPTLLDDIVGDNAKKFVEMSDEFCRYLPEFSRIRLETEIGRQRTYEPTGLTSWGEAAMGKGIYLETATGGTIRAQQASDGALLFLGFLSLLYTPNPPKVLLIEEPEKGVYPKRLAQIVGLLKRMIEDPGGREIPQIIFTTHSPYVLSHFQPEEVTFMSRQGDHAIARPLRDAPHIQERLAGGEFYLGELWYNLDEEELFPDVQA